jgi:hypothetical protein
MAKDIPLTGLWANRRGTNQPAHFWAPRGQNGIGDERLNYFDRRPSCGSNLTWREVSRTEDLTYEHDGGWVCQRCLKHWQAQKL